MIKNLTLSSGLAELIPLARSGKLIIFAGAGISVGAGMPTWAGTIGILIELCEKANRILPPTEKFEDLVAEIKSAPGADPLKAAQVLKQNLLQADQSIPGFAAVFHRKLVEVFAPGSPHENHKYIANTNYPYILTTNYDELIEKAAEEYHYELLLRSYGFENAAEVASCIFEEKSAILHLHGTIKDITLDKFILTSEDYQRVRKQYPGFTLAIQTLLLRYSVLFVGYGGKDPHMEDLVDELGYFMNWNNGKSDTTGRYFMVLPKSEVNELVKHYKQKLRTQIIAIDDPAETTTLLEELWKAAPR